MTFEVVGRLGPKMMQVSGISDCPRGSDNFGVDMEHPIVTNVDFVT